MVTYASSKGKVVAYTEVGARGPSIYNNADFWTKYVLQPILNDAKVY